LTSVKLKFDKGRFAEPNHSNTEKVFIIIHLLGGPGLVVTAAGAAGAAGAGGLLVPGGGGGAPDPEREQNI
jgi:hypothetical protein